MLCPLHQIEDTPSAIWGLATLGKADLVRFEQRREYVFESFGDKFGVDSNIGIEEGDLAIVRGGGGRFTGLGYSDDHYGERFIEEMTLLGG